MEEETIFASDSDNNAGDLGAERVELPKVNGKLAANGGILKLTITDYAQGQPGCSHWPEQRQIRSTFEKESQTENSLSQSNVIVKLQVSFGFKCKFKILLSLCRQTEFAGI